MKKILVLSFIVVVILFSSPYGDFSPSIYELQIIEADNWKLEINIFEDGYYSYDYFSIDTFMIKNKSDSAMVMNYTVYDSVFYDKDKLLVVTQDDLSKPLNFDRENDEITLVYYLNGEKFINSVKLGSYPGSVLTNIDSYQSICYDNFALEHYKSNTPTIGARNEAEVAIIYGRIFDRDSTVITNAAARFKSYIWPIIGIGYERLDEDGFFEVALLPRTYNYDSMIIWYEDESMQTLDLIPVELELEPGDSIEVNFYSTTVSIVPVIQTTINFNNYPHPASTYTWFFIDNTDVEASAMRVNVYALNGRKVDSFIPSAKRFRYDCAHLPQGSYVMSLQYGHEILATKKLQILK